MEKSNNTFTAEAFQKLTDHLVTKGYSKVCYDNKIEPLMDNKNLFDYVSTNKDNPKSIFICRIDKPESGNKYILASEIQFDVDGVLVLCPVVCISCAEGDVHSSIVKPFMDQYGENLIKE